MPGILKIGWTKKSPNKILKRANSSCNYWGPPTPFKFEFAKKVKDPAAKGAVFIKLLDTIKKCDISGHFVRDTPERIRMIFELIDGRWSVQIIESDVSSYTPMQVEEMMRQWKEITSETTENKTLWGKWGQ